MWRAVGKHGTRQPYWSDLPCLPVVVAQHRPDRRWFNGQCVRGTKQRSLISRVLPQQVFHSQVPRTCELEKWDQENRDRLQENRLLRKRRKPALWAPRAIVEDCCHTDSAIPITPPQKCCQPVSYKLQAGKGRVLPSIVKLDLIPSGPDLTCLLRGLINMEGSATDQSWAWFAGDSWVIST